MHLELSTWPEVEAYLERSDGIYLPTGSTEQHGPIGLIGTDTLCARSIASAAAEAADAMMAPAIGYTPAPFNMAFPGTLSVSAETFTALAGEIIGALAGHGFRHIYVVNGHGANIEPLRTLADNRTDAAVRIRSWWDFDTVNAIRTELFGDWEGMHATPSEVAITQATCRIVDDPGLVPPEKLSADFIARHAGDRHGPPDEHRRRFPDGRVGSHSSLARPEHGVRLLEAAAKAVAADYSEFLKA